MCIPLHTPRESVYAYDGVHYVEAWYIYTLTLTLTLTQRECEYHVVCARASPWIPYITTYHSILGNATTHDTIYI